MTSRPPQQPEQRSGVAVVSVWFEPDDPRPRARVVAESGPLGSPRRTWAAAGADEICARLRTWLESLVAEQS